MSTEGSRCAPWPATAGSVVSYAMQLIEFTVQTGTLDRATTYGTSAPNPALTCRAARTRQHRQDAHLRATIDVLPLRDVLGGEEAFSSPTISDRDYRRSERSPQIGPPPARVLR